MQLSNVDPQTRRSQTRKEPGGGAGVTSDWGLNDADDTGMLESTA